MGVVEVLHVDAAALSGDEIAAAPAEMDPQGLRPPRGLLLSASPVAALRAVGGG